MYQFGNSVWQMKLEHCCQIQQTTDFISNKQDIGLEERNSIIIEKLKSGTDLL